MAFPEVVSRERWVEARRALLAEEKAETRRHDVLNTKRRMLPMVRIDKTYVFDGPQGSATLADLFGDSRQLIIHHVMFGPDWEAACPSCTNAVDELSDGLLAHLRDRGTAFALVSRAPPGRNPKAARQSRTTPSRHDEADGLTLRPGTGATGSRGPQVGTLSATPCAAQVP